MTIYTNGPLMEPENQDISEFPLTTGRYVGESFTHGLEENPASELYRAGQVLAASARPEAPITDDMGNIIGMQRGRSVPSIPMEDAKKRVKDAGLEEQIPNLGSAPEVGEQALDIMMRHARERKYREAQLARGPSGILPGLLANGAGFLAGAIDPLNMAAFSIPVLGEARIARLMAGAGESIMGRATVRAGVGAAQGAVGTLPLIPLDAMAYSVDGRDYGFADALKSIAMNAGLGGALHAAGGGAADIYRGYTGKPLYPFAPGEPYERTPGAPPPPPPPPGGAPGASPAGGAPPPPAAPITPGAFPAVDELLAHPEVTGRPAHPRAGFSVSDVLRTPRVADEIESPQINRDHDVPYGSAASATEGTFIDRHVPVIDNIDGVSFDPAVPLNIARHVEREALDRATAQFRTRNGREPTDRELENILGYVDRHFTTPAEKAWVTGRGIDWDKYQEAKRDWQDRIDNENPAHPPEGPYTKPLPPRLRERLRGVAARSSEPPSASHPVADQRISPDLKSLPDDVFGPISNTEIETPVNPDDGSARLMLSPDEIHALRRAGLTISDDGLVDADALDALRQERARRSEERSNRFRTSPQREETPETQRLQALVKQLQSGEISEAEYETKRQEIVDEVNANGAATHGGTEAGKAEKAEEVNVEYHKETGIVRFYTGVGTLKGEVSNGALTIKNTQVREDKRGQGIAVALYLKAIEFAQENGLKVRSDKTVSSEAQRIYAALERRGFNIIENDGVADIGGGRKSHPDYVYEIGEYRPVPVPPQPTPAAEQSVARAEPTAAAAEPAKPQPAPEAAPQYKTRLERLMEGIEKDRAEGKSPIDLSEVLRGNAAPIMSRIPNKVMEFAPGDITIDAARFQFKSGGDEQGVTDRLRGVDKWDENLAGMLLVWESADGGFFVADGHQRAALAARIAAEHPEQNPRLVARVLSEKDGITDRGARTIAALTNIAEGTGTAIDAAKILRDEPELAGRLPPRSELVRQARGLANLEPEAFRLVIDEVAPANYAAIVGRLAPQDGDLQKALIALLGESDPANVVQAESIVRFGIERAAGDASRLPKGDEIAKFLFAERARILDLALKDLRRDKVVFTVLSRERERIEEAGNTLATDVNQKRLAADEVAVQRLQILAAKDGPVADALHAAAERLRADGKPDAAVREFVARLRGMAESGELARVADSGAERPVHVGAQDAERVADTAPEQPSDVEVAKADQEVRRTIRKARREARQAEAPAVEPAPQDTSAEALGATFRDELAKMRDEEAGQAAPPVAEPAPAPPTEAPAPPPERTTAEVAKAAGSHAVSALDEAATGLWELFGKGKRPFGGVPGFDEETHAAAKPHFVKAAYHFREFTGNVHELMRRLVRSLKDKYGFSLDAIEAMEPYAVRFVQDVHEGRIDLNKAVVEQERTAIASRLAPVIEKANRPREEAEIVAADVADRYIARAAAFEGRAGTASEMLNRPPVEIREGNAASDSAAERVFEQRARGYWMEGGPGLRELARLNDEGKTLAEMAAHFRVGTPFIFKTLDRNDIPLKNSRSLKTHEHGYWQENGVGLRELTRLNDDGASLPDIAAHFDVSEQFIVMTMKRNGIELKNSRTRWDEDQAAMLRDMERRGLSQAQMARELGISPAAVSKKFERMRLRDNPESAEGMGRAGAASEWVTLPDGTMVRRFHQSGRGERERGQPPPAALPMDEASRKARAERMGFRTGEPLMFATAPEGEKIAGAALDVDGRIITGRTHADALDNAERELGKPAEEMEMGPIADGFITTAGRYVSRREAQDIAKRQGQGETGGFFGEREGLAAEDLKRPRGRPARSASPNQTGATAPGLPGGQGVWGVLRGAETGGSTTGSPGLDSAGRLLWHRAERRTEIDAKGQEDWEIQLALQDAWEHGHDAVLLKDYTRPGGAAPEDIVVVRDLSQLRAPEAAFDPARRDEANIFYQRPTEPPALHEMPGIHLGQNFRSPRQFYQITAFHGSPHDFDKFEIRFVGAGEGVQAYGYGLYFAEEPEVARSYRDRLAGTPVETFNPHEDLAASYLKTAGSRENAISRLKQTADDYRAAGNFGYAKNYDGAAKLLESGWEAPVHAPGKLYQVSIKADQERFLDWDKPLSEQSEHVRKAIEGLEKNIKNRAFFRITENDLQNIRRDQYRNANTVEELIAPLSRGTSDAEATRILKEAGIAGIKYLDQGSRAMIIDPTISKEADGWYVREEGRLKPSSPGPFKTEGEAQAWIDNVLGKQTHNYVIFDDSKIEITHKDGTPVKADEREGIVNALTQKSPAGEPQGRVTFTNNARIIELFRTANASTLPHEFGHIWLEELHEDAARPDAPQWLKDDLKTVRDWLGAKGNDPLTTEQHEQFARGLEQYMREGRAPSRRLAAIFAKFAEWLRAIYRKAQDLGVEINDDVRGVIDRMLATQEDIAEYAMDRPPVEREPIEPPAAPGDSGPTVNPATGTNEVLPPVQSMKVLEGAVASLIEGRPVRAGEQIEGAKEPPPEQPATPQQPASTSGPRAKDPADRTLFEHLAANGGIKPDADLQHVLGRVGPFVPGWGPLLRPKGKPIDLIVRDGDVEAYLGKSATVRDLMAAISDEARGRKRYQMGNEPASGPDEDASRAAHEAHVIGMLEDAGIAREELGSDRIARVIEIMQRENVDNPEVAFEQAVMEEARRDEDTGNAPAVPPELHVPGWDDDGTAAPQEGGVLSNVEPAQGGGTGTPPPSGGQGPRAPPEPLIPAASLADHFRDYFLGLPEFTEAHGARLEEGNRFATIVQARRFAKEMGFGDDTKAIDEAIEQGAVAAARAIALGDGAPADKFAELVKLYDRQPRLSARTSTSMRDQAYSTPVPLAYVASRLAGIEGNHGPTGFTTAKGSTYQLHPDGTTTRNKAARSDVGHEGDSGIKARSARTVYVDDAAMASALSAAGLQNLGPKGARVIIRDGKASLLTWNDRGGKWGRSPISTNIAVSDQPAIGKAPLELWKPADDVPGWEAYRGMHAGNPITEITRGGPKRVYEPSAGNGALLMEVEPPEFAEANEINPARAEALKDQGFHVTQYDASDPYYGKQLRKGGGADVVIANPPFGAVKEGASSKVFDLGDIQRGYKTHEIDHAIVLRSLEAMKDDGSAVLLIGGVNKLARTPEARSEAYNVKAKREFFKVLHDTYNVTDIFTVAGELYERQGAGWPIDVIVIEGRGKSARPLPAVEPPRVYKTWDELAEVLNAQPGRNERLPGRQPGEAPVELPPAAEGTGNAGGGEAPGSGGAEAGIAPAGEPGAVRVGPVPGEPGDVAPGGAGAEPPPAAELGPGGERGGAGGPGGEPAAERPSPGVAEPLRLVGALRNSTRTTKIGGETDIVADPHAENILKRSPEDLRKIEDILAANGITELKPLAGGFSSLVLDAGDKVVRLGEGELGEVPDIPEYAKPLAQGEFGSLRIEILPKLDTEGITEADVQAMKDRLARRGLHWGDAGTDNLARDEDGKLKIIDGRITATGEDKENPPAASIPSLKGAEKRAAPAPQPVRPRIVKTETETGAQVAYTPQSSHSNLGTLVPVNMKKSVSDALAAVAERHGGDVDKFVADEIGYSRDQLANAFAAEQVDALALALDNIKQGKGFIIGDQTGIGKGRVNAGIIRWAIRNNRIPIFVTEKPNLYGDMYRDLTDIGLADMLGREPRFLMTNAGEDVPLSEDGKVRLKSPSAKAHNAMLAALPGSANAFLKDYDAVFTNYSQMQTVAGEDTARRAFLSRIAPEAVVIFDESHNAGGQKSDFNKPGPPDRAAFARQLVAAAKGVFYSSATYAKRPDVMDLYSKTDMALAVDNVKNLGEAIAKGGVPMQQAVAAMLARAGQYVRRERSFAGIRYDTPSVPVDRGTYDGISRALNAINQFSLHVADAADKLDQDIKAQAAGISSDGSTGNAGAQSTNFTSIMHNIVGQMLLAMKAKPAAKMAIAALEKGEKPVLTVSSTMEAFLTDYAEQLGIKHGEPIPADFGHVLKKYLDRTRTLIIRKPFMAKGEKAERRYLSDSDLGPLGLRAYKDAMALIGKLDLKDLPISPIDAIKNELTQAGYRVGEITGRGTIVDYSDKRPILRPRPGAEVTIKGRRDTISRFNGGGKDKPLPKEQIYDAMILNQAGSTGLSLHASERVADQRPRVMFIVQPEANIDTHMQLLGRIHRTGQVVLPRYEQLIADIPAEKRPAAVLAKKMASLNANTTAARGSAMTAKDVPDFMNVYGDMVAAALVSENPELNARLGSPVDIGENGRIDAEDAMRKLTGRIPLLPLGEQERLYSYLESEYNSLLEQMKAAGENALEAQTLDLRAQTVERREVVARREASDSPFAAPVQLEKAMVRRLGKPFRSDEVVSKVLDTIGHTPAEAVTADNASRLLDGIGNKRTPLGQLAAQRHERQAKDAIASFESYKRGIVDAIENPDKQEAEREKQDATKDRWTNLHEQMAPGERIILKTANGNLTGIVLKIEQRGKPKNPLALSTWKVEVALADAVRRIELPFSRLYSEGRAPYDDESAIEIGHITDWQETKQKTLQRFDSLQSDTREERYIATGNLLAAYDWLKRKGRIVNYTDAEGHTRQGILTPKDFDLTKHAEENATSIGDAAAVMRWLRDNPDKVLSTSDGAVSINFDPGRGRSPIISIAGAKRHGGVYYLDKDLTTALGRDFVKRGQRMEAETAVGRLEGAIRRIQELGGKFVAVKDLPAAESVAAPPPRPPPMSKDEAWHSLASEPLPHEERESVEISRAAEKMAEPASVATEPAVRVKAAEKLQTEAAEQYESAKEYMSEEDRAAFDSAMQDYDREQARKAEVIRQGIACLSAGGIVKGTGKT